MGILIALKDYQESQFVYMAGLIGLTILGILYYWKVHSFIFKPKPTGRKAVFISLIGTGFGQVYNRQVGKGIIFASVLPFMYIISLTGLYDLDKEGKAEIYAGIAFGTMILACIDAGKNARKARGRVLRSAREKEVKEKVTSLMKYRVEKYQFAVDTNVLMHEPDLLVYLLENEKMELMISMKVFDELEGLKKNPDPLTRKKAQLAFDVIEAYQIKNALKMMDTAKSDEIKKYGLGHRPDERIIGTYLKAYHNGQKIVFLSNDKGARIMARKAGLPVADIG